MPGDVRRFSQLWVVLREWISGPSFHLYSLPAEEVLVSPRFPSDSHFSLAKGLLRWYPAEGITPGGTTPKDCQNKSFPASPATDEWKDLETRAFLSLAMFLLTAKYHFKKGVYRTVGGSETRYFSKMGMMAVFS